MTTSGIRPPGDVKYALREIRRGLFVVDNAYAGRYEFFKGRPAPAVTPGNSSAGSTQQNGFHRNGSH